MSSADGYAGRLVFDGECGFCTRCVDWLRRLDPQGKIDVQPFQAEGVPASIGATVEECQGAVQFLGPDGVRRSGADAVNAVLAVLTGTALPSTLYRASSGLQERAYRWVADHRSRFPGTTPHCQRAPQGC
ncbi:thiol-disulfide oxidoreductase DCC family protein [Actinomycetospora sp. CA-101289]|uniref:thiol-disulfide oxidoreductase DCC family protein n=1 Tax=Actinomycetospora sp. CA-101289 TaxID=3239893 RepID=UPI003D985E11